MTLQSRNILYKDYSLNPKHQNKEVATPGYTDALQRLPKQAEDEEEKEGGSAKRVDSARVGIPYGVFVIPWYKHTLLT